MGVSNEAVLAEITSRSQAIVARLEDIKAEPWSWDGPSSEASWFAMKAELLVAYCTKLSCYLVGKVSGASVRDHGVLDELFELRLVMEKLRVLESKLRHQLDRVLRSDQDAALKPNPAALVSPPPADDSADAVYRPPRVASVPYAGQDDDEPVEQGEPPQPPQPRARTTRSRRAEIMRIVRDNDAVHPERVSSTGASTDVLGTGAKAARRERLAKEAKERADFEEDRFIRVESSKKAKKRRRINPFTSSLDDLL